VKLTDHIKVTIKTSHTGDRFIPNILDAVKAMDEGDVYLIPAPVADAVVAVVEAAEVVSDRLVAEWIPLELTDDNGREDGDAGENLLEAIARYKEVSK